MRIVIFLLALPFVCLAAKNMIRGLKSGVGNTASMLYALKASAYMIVASAIMLSYWLF